MRVLDFLNISAEPTPEHINNLKNRAEALKSCKKQGFLSFV